MQTKVTCFSFNILANIQKYDILDQWNTENTGILLYFCGTANYTTFLEKNFAISKMKSRLVLCFTITSEPAFIFQSSNHTSSNFLWKYTIILIWKYICTKLTMRALFMISKETEITYMFRQGTGWANYNNTMECCHSYKQEQGKYLRTDRFLGHSFCRKK